jgi:hypothetical protein
MPDVSARARGGRPVAMNSHSAKRRVRNLVCAGSGLVLAAFGGVPLLKAEPLQWTTRCAGEFCISVTPDGNLFTFDQISGPTYRAELIGFVGPARVSCAEIGACVVADSAGHSWTGDAREPKVWTKSATRKRIE